MVIQNLLVGGGIFCIFLTLLPHFRRKTIIIYLFIASYICSNGLLYLDVSHFKFCTANFYYILRHFLTFYPIFWLKIQNLECYPPISYKVPYCHVIPPIKLL